MDYKQKNYKEKNYSLGLGTEILSTAALMMIGISGMTRNGRRPFADTSLWFWGLIAGCFLFVMMIGYPILVAVALRFTDAVLQRRVPGDFVVKHGWYCSYGGSHFLRRIGASFVFDSVTFMKRRGKFLVAPVVTGSGVSVYYGRLTAFKLLCEFDRSEVCSVGVSGYRVFRRWQPVLEFRILVDGGEEFFAVSPRRWSWFRLRGYSEAKVLEMAERAAATLGVPFDSEVRERDIDSYRFTPEYID